MYIYGWICYSALKSFHGYGLHSSDDGAEKCPEPENKHYFSELRVPKFEG